MIAGALGVVPTYTIAFFNGGDLRSLISQTHFFYIMFAATGLVVGVGYAVVHRNAPAP